MSYLKELCSFKTAKRLEKRGINAFLKERGISPKHYFDKQGQVSSEKTAYPCVSYETIFRWLESLHIYALVGRVDESEVLHGMIYLPTGKCSPEGEVLLRRRGRVYTGTDFDRLSLEMMDRAIAAVPLCRRYI